MAEEAPFPATGQQMPLPGPVMNQQETINTLQEMFPRVDVNWLEGCARAGVPMDIIIEQLLDPHHNVPMRNLQRSSVNRRDSLEASSNQLSPNHIRSLLSICNNNYFAAALALKNHIESQDFVYPKSNETQSFVLRVKRADGRTDQVSMLVNNTDRQQQYHVPEDFPNWLHVQKNMVEAASTSTSFNSNSNMECPICTDEVSMDTTTFCSFGHIFCRECVVSYIKENVYGQAKASLTCMEIECEGEFEMGEVRKFIGRDAWEKLNERKDEEALLAVNTENVERCPYCNYAVIMEMSKAENKVFKCARSQCLAEICRICGKDWDDEHMGVKCEILNKNTEETKRREYEEKMALSVIRHCHCCKLPLSKAGGCNKMRCTCGATLCYLCRTPDINYNHFCRHTRSPGERCSLCSSCFLFEDAEKTDRVNLRKLQIEANAQLPSSSHFSLVSAPTNVNRPNDHQVNVDGDGNRIVLNGNERIPLRAQQRRNPFDPSGRFIAPHIVPQPPGPFLQPPRFQYRGQNPFLQPPRFQYRGQNPFLQPPRFQYRGQNQG